MHLGAIPTIEARHDSLHARFNRRVITRRMNVTQLGFRHSRITLVNAASSPAVADKMLRRRNYSGVVEKAVLAGTTLQSVDNPVGIGRDNLRIFGETFIGSAPAIVTRGRKGWRESPVMAGNDQFCGGDLHNLFNEIRVPGSTKANIVRKDCCPRQIRMTMDGINPPNHRNRNLDPIGIDRSFKVRIGSLKPGAGVGIIFVTGCRIPARQDRPQTIGQDFLGRHTIGIGLNGLSDFLLESHLRQD
mmetsp:Transcript_5559/g.6786  ORF Transcript_5559/g.6786 Transcript_5559/m.6786 type:complete len:245 (+) Transcript_5559:2891-3625(+)